MDTRTIRVQLSPKPGFCVKSAALQSAACKVSPSSSATKDQKKDVAVLSDAITIPKGMKIFLNIAWDANVPPPPEGSEEAIQKTMAGEDELDEDALASGEGWFVPVIVSEPRLDVDKAGKPSVVFDCVYNSSLKSRSTRDAAFRTFLIELALQRIEAQYSLQLSRQIGTPNIASKGKLASRSALVPLALFPAAHVLRAEAAKGQKKLVEEVQEPVSGTPAKAQPSPQPSQPKGILKSGPAKADADGTQERPVFEWEKEGDKIKITVGVPNLTHADIAAAALDVEPRRVILDIPSRYHLDIDLSMSDAQIMSTFGGTSSEGSPLMLKRQREFDVDSVTAEWRVQESTLILYV